MRRDPRGPRDFYAPPKSPDLPPPSRSRRATRVLALLYVVCVAATVLFCVAAVENVVESGRFSRGSWDRDWVELGMRGGLLVWLLSCAAFQVRREEGAWGLGVFVLASGLLTGGLLALVSLPVAGRGEPGSDA